MATSNYTSTFVVDNSAEDVFNAINNVSGWWQGEIKGNTEKLNDKFSYQMKEVHFSKQKIVEFIPNEKVVWLVTDSKLNFANQAEWTGTKIIFEITEINNKTQVRFTHLGLVSTFECYGGCSWAWGELMQQSLFSLITAGKGTNVFGQFNIALKMDYSETVFTITQYGFKQQETLDHSDKNQGQAMDGLKNIVEEIQRSKSNEQLTQVLQKLGICAKFEHWNSIEHLC